MSKIGDGVPKKFNYAFIMGLLLKLLRGVAACHVNLLNAFAGCEEYWLDAGRIIEMDGTNNRRVISEMKNEKRNAPKSIQELFCTGKYLGNEFYLPSAERFKIVIKDNFTFYQRDGDIIFRKTVCDCLVNGNNGHLDKDDTETLLKSADEDDIETFAFNCVYYAIMCKKNTAKRKPNKSRNTKVYNKAKRFTDTANPNKIELMENDGEEDKKE